MSKIYTRYLDIIRNVEPLPVDLMAQRLLDEIALRQAKGSLITVTQAMGLSHIASPATLHRKLDELLDAKLINQNFGEKDRRTKYLVPSKKAHAYFTTLGSAMALAGVNK